jgi:hypothetical protein
VLEEDAKAKAGKFSGGVPGAGLEPCPRFKKVFLFALILALTRPPNGKGSVKMPDIY